MKTVDIKNKIDDISNSVETKANLSTPLVAWRPILAKECQVYVYNESYLAKRFDQINYKFCTLETAEEILIDNLYALLRFKYFPKADDVIDERINDIVKSFTKNLKTSLIRISFNADEECNIVKWLPNGCVAFRNGVYDFRNDTWMFKYNVINIPNLQNTIFMYDPQYIITWYININFEPLPVGIKDTSLPEFIELMKGLDLEDKNFCFELMYNMAHDSSHQFDINRFTHLCQILGYLCYQSFCQKFVLLIGSGQNGKNSLFDGCFTDRVVPKPASIDLESIETDKFIGGALENKAQNIYLETSTNDTVYKDSTHLKGLTGSQDQNIERKGKDRYSGIINCKYVWSANDQDKVKFSDTTEGFRRRINIFEIFFHWDKEKRFMKKGDYYDTTFSEDLHELKENTSNVIVFIYFAMYGIKTATSDFAGTFKFNSNDWQLGYANIDFSLKEQIEMVTPQIIYEWINRKVENRELGKTLFYDLSRKRLPDSDTLKEIGYYNYEEFLKFLLNEDDFINYFVDHDVFISVNALGSIIKCPEQGFAQKFKKIYGLSQLEKIFNNRPYARVKFVNNKLKIVLN